MAKKKPEDSKKVKKLKHQARRRSIREGIFAASENSFGFRFLSPFAIAINASNSMVAMLGSITGLLGPLSQLFGSKLIDKYSRKKILLKAIFWAALIWLPMILLAILYHYNLVRGVLPLMFIFFFGIRVILTNIGAPAWFSWMGDIVDDEFRGRWFSKRQLIVGFISIILAIAASFFLDFVKNYSLTMAGFGILFALAMISRLTSWKLLKGQYEPKLELKKGEEFPFLDFLLKSPKNNLGRFTLFRASLAFAQAIGSSLFAVYLLRTIGFDYKFYMFITIAGTVFSLSLIELWGKFADRYGNYTTLIITSFFIPSIPILWILSRSPIYLILVPSIIGGIAWAGFNLASSNFIYDNTSPEKRGRVVSYYNMFLGIGTFLGAGLGAILIKYIPSFLSLEPIVIIFIICGLARMAAIMMGLYNIKEVKKTKKFKRKSLKNIILKETPRTLHEEAHQIMSIKKYLINS